MARHIASRSDGSPFSKQKWKRNPRFSSTFHLHPTYSLHMSRRRTLLFVLFVLFVLWLWGNLSGLPWGIPCLFHQFTGLSCPGCGTQRALFALLHGHPLAAWHSTIFCPSLSSSSSHSHFFPAARAHSIVRSPHRPH